MNISDLTVPRECEKPVLLECSVAVWMMTVGPVALLLLGTLGNITSVIVLARKKLRENSTSVYLMCLSISDLSFLYWSVSRQFSIRILGFDIRQTSAVFCHTQAFFIAVSGGMSGWLLGLVTIERIIMIKFPILARQNLTGVKAIVSCSVLFALMVGLNGHLIFDFQSTDIPTTPIGNETGQVMNTTTVCLRTDRVLGQKVRKLMNLTVLNSMPTCMVSIGNLFIAWTLLRQKMRRTRTDATIQSPSGTPSGLEKKKAATAKMLLLVCGINIITTLPHSIFRLTSSGNDTDRKAEAQKQLLYATFSFLFYSNFTFNFLIYITRGTIFKDEFWKMIRSIKNR